MGLLCVLLLSACASAPAIKDFDRASAETSNEPQKMEPNFIPPSGAFASVVAEVEPVGEDLCRRFRPQLNCDFEVVVYKKNPNLVNAFQTIRSNGRPLVVFSQGLIEHARNEDELAFVLGHEMAHHLEGHLYQQYHTARSGAERFGGLISLVGASDRLVRNAERLGARLGERKFSKSMSWKRIGWALGLLRSRGMMLCAALPFLCACRIRLTSFWAPIRPIRRGLRPCGKP